MFPRAEPAATTFNEGGFFPRGIRKDTLYFLILLHFRFILSHS